MESPVTQAQFDAFLVEFRQLKAEFQQFKAEFHQLRAKFDQFKESSVTKHDVFQVTCCSCRPPTSRSSSAPSWC